MKPSAFLVNTARGGLVDEDALVDALESGAVAGAALDVFRDEPLPDDHPLLDREGVVLSPHVAGSTRDAVLGGPRIVAAQLAHWLERKRTGSRRSVNYPPVRSRETLAPLRKGAPLVIELRPHVARVAERMLANRDRAHRDSP